MTIATDVDAQVTIDSTTRDAAIVAATSKVSGYAYSIGGITIAQTAYVSTDAIITELAVKMIQRHQDNLKMQGMSQIEFSPIAVLTKEDRGIIRRTVKQVVMASVGFSSYTSPTGNSKAWLEPDW